MVHVVILLINNVIGLVSTLQFTIRPYKSWNYVHEFYGEISQFVEAQKSPGDNLQAVVALYAAPLYSLIFFIFFGLGEEAITEYIAIYHKCLQLLERTGLRAKSTYVHSISDPTQSHIDIQTCIHTFAYLTKSWIKSCLCYRPPASSG